MRVLVKRGIKNKVKELGELIYMYSRYSTCGDLILPILVLVFSFVVAYWMPSKTVMPDWWVYSTMGIIGAMALVIIILKVSMILEDNKVRKKNKDNKK